MGSDSNKTRKKTMLEAAVAKITEAALKKREESVVANIRQFPKGMFLNIKLLNSSGGKSQQKQIKRHTKRRRGLQRGAERSR